MAASVSDTLRKSLQRALSSGVTRYRVAKEIGVALTTISNFIDPPEGKPAADLRLSTVDALAALLGLELTRSDRPAPIEKAPVSTRRTRGRR